jgi:hypothetical protein
LRFRTEEVKPFVCVSKSTTPETLLKLLTYRWGLQPPRLLISVTGGAKSFDLPPLLDKLLKIGLKRAAAASKAWFITGGSNSGEPCQLRLFPSNE